ncbi:YSIRK-type signal peptide-containing protein [Limosilactobacillus kribbianus]|uniref:YSIRK-type signal peptide-containing protein n=1 Tax=Limosilactobacillus kribbianus TaxID=2982695 RepID=UPI0022640E63|nr:YSIRK-type signal peptide-containing protein [Limosilactobacillus kribbianus]
MVSKNNDYLKKVMHSHRVPHYGLRKLGIGVTSVLLGTTLYFGANTPVYADATPATNSNDNTGANVTPTSAAANVESGQSVVLGQGSNSAAASTATPSVSSAPASQAAVSSGTDDAASAAPSTSATPVAESSAAESNAQKANSSTANNSAVSLADNQSQQQAQTV